MCGGGGGGGGGGGVHDCKSPSHTLVGECVASSSFWTSSILRAMTNLLPASSSEMCSVSSTRRSRSLSIALAALRFPTWVWYVCVCVWGGGGGVFVHVCVCVCHSMVETFTNFSWQTFSLV